MRSPIDRKSNTRINLEINSRFPVGKTPSALHRKYLKSEVLLWKRNTCFPSSLSRKLGQGNRFRCCYFPLILNYSVRSLYPHTNSYNNAVTRCHIDCSKRSLGYLCVFVTLVRFWRLAVEIRLRSDLVPENDSWWALMWTRHFLSYFFVKKIPLSRRVGYVMDGSMGQWVSVWVSE